jgi:hypothetical protein
MKKPIRFLCFTAIIAATAFLVDPLLSVVVATFFALLWLVLADLED